MDKYNLADRWNMEDQFIDARKDKKEPTKGNGKIDTKPSKED